MIVSAAARIRAGELEQVVERGAAPRVDVLVRVADRRHRVPVPEQGVHQICLGDVRVLVLVQEHGAEPGAMIGDDLRVPLRDLDRAIDLVPEVDHAQLALELPVPRARLGELEPLLGGLVHAVGSRVLEQFQPGRHVRLDLHRPHPMVLGLFVELEDLRHEGGLPRRGGMLEGHPVEHA